jgi:hypothetical protein
MATMTSTIRVASVPASHVYIRHLSDPDGLDNVVRLLDPPPTDPMPLVGQWWPPAMLTPEWVKEHHDEFDVFHVQFGFDAQDPGRLSELVSTLETFGKPLIYTVHDLRNPHHEDPVAHDRHLDILIPAAAELITLTNRAADVIDQRWHRRPHVLPHPHVVDFDRMSRPRAEHERYVIGVHAKSVRASMAPLPVIRTLAALVSEVPEMSLAVNVHTDVFASDGDRHDPALADFLRASAGRGELDLHVHDFLTDDQLWDYLQGLDVSVLPYRFGTHSGWLEACFDLGTTVIAPDCGFYAQQRQCLSYHHDELGLDPQSLRAAVLEAFRRRPSWRADPEMRRAERAQLADRHEQIYRAALGR